MSFILAFGGTLMMLLLEPRKALRKLTKTCRSAKFAILLPWGSGAVAWNLAYEIPYRILSLCLRPACFTTTVRPGDTRPRAARTSQVHVFELGPKKFEMNEFMKWKPWAARFSDHLAFTLLSNKSCTNFELHEFFLSPKNVHLKALLYLVFWFFQWPWVPIIHFSLQ